MRKKSRQTQKIQKENEEIPKSGREISEIQRDTFFQGLLSHKRGGADTALTFIFSLNVFSDSS